MPSSKGKPTDPKLKEKVTEEVKNKPNKDGSGKGQMAAWKAAQIGKEYEARGGDYENEAGSKNKPEKGPPQKKTEETKKTETETEAETKTEAKEETNGDKAKATKETKAKKDPKPKKAAKPKKEPKKGERSSARQAASTGQKRKIEGDDVKEDGKDGVKKAKK